MDEREFLPAVTALEKFRNLQLSPVELLNALIARSEKVEPSINAFTERYFDEALEKAAEAEQRYADGTADSKGCRLQSRTRSLLGVNVRHRVRFSCRMR